MILTRDAILAEIAARRLRIEPFTLDQVGPASIDLHLGDAERQQLGLEQVGLLGERLDLSLHHRVLVNELGSSHVFDPFQLAPSSGVSMFYSITDILSSDVQINLLPLADKSDRRDRYPVTGRVGL